MRTELRDNPAWRTLQAACRKLKEVIQAREDWCLASYARQLEGHTRLRDMRGWRRHLKGDGGGEGAIWRDGELRASYLSMTRIATYCRAIVKCATYGNNTPPRY